MILGAKRLREGVGKGLVKGVGKDAIQPASIDLHLELGIFKTFIPLTMASGEFFIACVQEEFDIPVGLMGIICGVSTIARRGLQVEAAGLLDPGYHGRPTLEIFNQRSGPLDLTQGMRIAQVYFMEVDGAEPYNGRYQGDMIVSGPKPEVIHG